MDKNISTEVTLKVIIENLKHLHFLLSTADSTALHALESVKKADGNLALAFEEMADLDGKLRDAWAVYRAVASLHFWRCNQYWRGDL